MNKLLCAAFLLLSFTAGAQAGKKYRKPMDSLVTAVMLHENDKSPYAINIFENILYDTGTRMINKSTVELNKSCDTLRVNSVSVIKVIKVGQFYYRPTAEGALLPLGRSKSK